MVEPPDDTANSEVTLYPPQALATADGSVGLMMKGKHVRVGRYQDLIKKP